MGFLSDLVGGGAAYYAGKEGISDAEAAGAAGLAVGQELGTTAAGMAEFKPYTVTSNLVQSAATTPEGWFRLTTVSRRTSTSEPVLRSSTKYVWWS